MNSWKEIGKTEILKNTLEPVFHTPISVDYIFGVQQQLKFVMEDLNGTSIEKIGSATLSLAELLYVEEKNKGLNKKTVNLKIEFTVTGYLTIVVDKHKSNPTG